MKRAAKWLGGIALGLVVLALALVAHTWYFKPLKLDWFYARVFAAYAIDSPEMLSDMRILPGWLDFYSKKLDDASPAHSVKQMAQLKQDLAMLESYSTEGLDAEGKLSYDTLRFFLKSQVEGEAFIDHGFPVNQMMGVQSMLPQFMTDVHQVTDKGEAAAYIARLNLFPVKFGQVAEAIRHSESKGIVPPKFTVDKVLAEMKAVVATPVNEHVLVTNMRDKLAKVKELSDTERSALLAQTEKAVQEAVYPAYGKLIDAFTALQSKATTNNGAWSLPNGEAYYAWAVRQHTTSNLTPQQVHELGLAEVERVGAEMDAILKGEGLAEGSIGKRVQILASRPEQQYANTDEGKKAMLAQYQAILDEVNKGLDPVFDVRPKLGVEVQAVPVASQATAPGAYYMQGSFDGSRPGVFYANMRAPGETPKFAMRTLAYHEGIPGHHFQIAIQQEMTGVPFFRKIIPFTAYNEGWALYAERLAAEQGFQKTQLDNLGRLRDEMMRATRLVVDTGIHYKRWTREQAIDYMMNTTGMAEGDVTAEIERYFVNPGQALAYKVGMLKILALREQAKKELGNKFDLKQFHNEVLIHGALPLTLLEGVVNDWVAKRKTA
ncbi:MULTISPECIES: DUF885 family protein [unclassified Duganella]|uniref:DUF885 domain-containing protein n=1 Tax=unclassified Duganella TaxID=2636909 RepID=UPI0006FC1A7A|nr:MULTISPECIES: DUF885 domain-containing protein [unclassified Duganella]KQV47579.1 hypothetical protein ASD07_11600 [Duganella sp. Root336D2]KRC00008.1 hypothetical protein ASE26_23535 [Duganella sp. Root198D2]